MRYVAILVAACILLLAGLKWAINVKSDPPNKEALGLVRLAAEALDEAANHLEKGDATKEELADGLRERAATVRVGLSEIGK